ncbi:hypothetical protein BDR26DRAFT_1008127 [Obelidium mucronatum]|nr:hypothetical protein BDR26DRAFT_1008127 [Obelidium mucronatum]
MFRQGRTYTSVKYKKAQQQHGSDGSNTSSEQVHPVWAFTMTVLKLTAIASVPLLLVYLEHSRADTQAAVAEGLLKVVPISPTTPAGSLVFAQSHLIKPDLITDPSFALEFNGAVRVKRNAEYCQWQEFSNKESHTERDDDGNERTITTTTYYYNKGWYPYRINSLFFDQPAAHHNPQRDPFPSVTTTAAKADLGDYVVSKNVLEHANDGWSTRKRYSGSELDQMSQESLASGDFGFRYIGDGYFYSEYEASHTATFLRAAGMALEGSLLDYQIADVVNNLFGQCKAGDIRVSYQAIVTTSEQGASVIGELGPDLKTIGIYQTVRGYKMGLFENRVDGVSPKTMFGKLLTEAFWWLLGGYAVVCVWAGVVMYYYPWNPLRGGSSAAGSSSGDERNPLDVYFWTGEAVALAVTTVGVAKILGTDDTVTGGLIAAVGVGLLAVLNTSVVRSQFGEEKEKRD